MLVFSGIWPFLKQILTIQAVGGSYSPQQELNYLKFLGVSGKSAFLDIAIVCIIVTLLNFPLSIVVVEGVAPEVGHITTTPAIGTLVVIIGLILSRVLTSLLIHVFPPSISTNKVHVDGIVPPLDPKNDTRKQVVGSKWSILGGVILTPICVFGSLVSPWITRTYTVQMRFPEISGTDPLILDTGSDKYDLWQLIDGARLGINGDSSLERRRASEASEP